ncbi:hypothetical protein HPB50_007269 [Hyalomma asiaticum]|uniref:Uncharacterized protein n=1 Tax=Hyalomma asiaticum TaxID=266040 RepID=A0ACB7RMD6_HYAAI|nr:hypothetical protein HPB50_007269 [Hyalomma asiaticum]
MYTGGDCCLHAGDSGGCPCANKTREGFARGAGGGPLPLLGPSSCSTFDHISRLRYAPSSNREPYDTCGFLGPQRRGSRPRKARAFPSRRQGAQPSGRGLLSTGPGSRVAGHKGCRAANAICRRWRSAAYFRPPTTTEKRGGGGGGREKGEERATGCAVALLSSAAGNPLATVATR